MSAPDSLTPAPDSFFTRETPEPAHIGVNSTAEQLLTGKAFCCQIKLDGRRCVIRCDAGAFTAHTRGGNSLRLPNEITAQLPVRDSILDVEKMGETWLAFDLISLPAEPRRRLRNASS